jgi:hypothetical protein
MVGRNSMSRAGDRALRSGAARAPVPSARMTPHHGLAAVCPGCGMPILFDELELAAPDHPVIDDVMCACCGTVSRRSRLRHQAYVLPTRRSQT